MRERERLQHDQMKGDNRNEEEEERGSRVNLNPRLKQLVAYNFFRMENVKQCRGNAPNGIVAYNFFLNQRCKTTSFNSLK